MSENRAAQTGSCRPILFQAINHTGLGHLSRLSAIALSLREQAAEIPLVFAVDGGSHGLLEALDLSFVSLSFSRSGGRSDWTRPDRERLQRSLAESLIATLSPAAVVFDLVPNRELMRAALESGIPCVLCLRKTKNMDERVRRGTEFARGFSLILVAHAPGEVLVPEGLAERTRFVGTIARPLSCRPGPSPGPQVVISGGGGGYPGTVEFYNRSLTAYALCRRQDRSLTGLLVAGPLFQDWAQLQPVEGIQIVPFDPAMTATFASARVVVCQAGYNTIAEVQAIGVPAICVPADRGLDDQFERAARTAEENPQVRVSPGDDPTVLAGLIRERLAWTGERPARPLPGGGRLAAEHLLRLLR